MPKLGRVLPCELGLLLFPLAFSFVFSSLLVFSLMFSLEVGQGGRLVRHGPERARGIFARRRL